MRPTDRIFFDSSTDFSHIDNEGSSMDSCFPHSLIDCSVVILAAAAAAFASP